MVSSVRGAGLRTRADAASSPASMASTEASLGYGWGGSFTVEAVTGIKASGTSPSLLIGRELESRQGVYPRRGQLRGVSLDNYVTFNLTSSRASRRHRYLCYPRLHDMKV